MESAQIQALIAGQRRYFASGATRDPANRRALLEKLLGWTGAHQGEIMEALHADLNKSGMEAYMTEIGMVLEECRFQLRHFAGWARTKRVRTPLAQFPAGSYVMAEPFGTVLIMSPWNYPFQLSLEPLLGAVAAGNTALLKPSAYATATSRLLKRMMDECAEPGWVAVVEGGRAENAALLEEKFDYIFFTGSVEVGRLVMAKAARHLTPVSLELGGKSPALVEPGANLAVAAKRLAFGKCLNAGQTCVAPDYVLVQEQVKDRFATELVKALRSFHPAGALHDDTWPRIINEKHFQRLLGLMEGVTVLYGGGSDRASNRIEPTLLDEVIWDAPVMGEEIFGPLLPLLTYRELDEAIAAIQARPRPLALYLFTEREEVKQRVLREISFGGGCVNDTVIHLATSRMGFGGVGDSGMGSYHGKKSFDTFTHYKSIVDKATALDLNMRYPPYTERNFNLVKRFLK